jgi:hypothetical protein
LAGDHPDSREQYCGGKNPAWDPHLQFSFRWTDAVNWNYVTRADLFSDQPEPSAANSEPVWGGYPFPPALADCLRAKFRHSFAQKNRRKPIESLGAYERKSTGSDHLDLSH